VAHLQPEIPERVEQLLHHALDVWRQLAVVDHHQVDVRERVELAAPITAERHDHQRGRRQAGAARVGGDEPGEREDHIVHEARVGADRLLAGRALGVSDFQRVEPLSERLPEEFEPQPAPVLGALGPCLCAPGPAKQLDGHMRERSNPERRLSNATQTY